MADPSAAAEPALQPDDEQLRVSVAAVRCAAMTLRRLVNPVAYRACGALLAASAGLSLVRCTFWTANGERRW
jgi:hypothetical protein